MCLVKCQLKYVADVEVYLACTVNMLIERQCVINDYNQPQALDAVRSLDISSPCVDGTNRLPDLMMCAGVDDYGYRSAFLKIKFSYQSNTGRIRT